MSLILDGDSIMSTDIHTTFSSARTTSSRRGRIVAALSITLLVALGAVGAALSIIGLPLVALVAGLQGAAVFAAGTKRGWEPTARIGAGLGTIGAVGVLVAVGAYWWLAPVALLGILGWFAGRTVRRYLRPAATMPGEVLRRLESLVTLSDEAVAGMRVGARKDGAVLAFGYVAVGNGEVSSDRGVQRFIDDAATAREILGRSGAGHSEIVCIVDRAGVFEKVSGYRVVGPDRIGEAVRGAQAPDREVIVEAAKAAGIELTREQRRGLEGGVKRTNPQSGKKIRHQGRVTKVERD